MYFLKPNISSGAIYHLRVIEIKKKKNARHLTSGSMFNYILSKLIKYFLTYWVQITHRASEENKFRAQFQSTTFVNIQHNGQIHPISAQWYWQSIWVAVLEGWLDLVGY